MGCGEGGGLMGRVVLNAEIGVKFCEQQQEVGWQRCYDIAFCNSDGDDDDTDDDE